MSKKGAGDAGRNMRGPDENARKEGAKYMAEWRAHNRAKAGAKPKPKPKKQ